MEGVATHAHRLGIYLEGTSGGYQIHPLAQGRAELLSCGGPCRHEF